MEQTESKTIEEAPLSASELPLCPWITRGWLLYCGALIPLIASVIALFENRNSNMLVLPTYQTGRWYEKFAFVLIGESLWPFYPLLILAFLSVVGFSCYEKTWGKSAIAIFGYITGVMLSGWFHFVHVIQFGESVVIVLYHLIVSLVFFGVFGFTLYHEKLQKRFPRLGMAYLSFVFLICIIVLLISLGSNSSEPVRLLFISPSLFIIACLIVAPYLMLLSVSTTLAYVLLKYPLQRKFGLRALMLVWVPWFAAYFAAIRHSMQKSLEIYSSLPTEPPNNCFIVTASMRGHPKWVKSERVMTPFGSAQINLQLKRFKAMEIVFKLFFPRLHRLARWGYAFWGPAIASRMTKAWHCDCVYFALKPWEWLVAVALSMTLGAGVKSIEKLYQDTSK